MPTPIYLKEGLENKKLEKAIRKVSKLNQIKLMNAALNAPVADVRKAAVDNVTAQNMLVEISTRTDDIDLGMIALGKVTDQHHIKEIALKASRNAICEAAVGRLTDRHALAVVGKLSQNANIAKAAIDKLSYQYSLAEIVRYSPIEEVRTAALDKLTDKKLLAEVIKENNNKNTSIAAVKKLTDPEKLSEIIKRSRDNDVSLAAIDMLSDQRELTIIAKHRKLDSGLRKAAIAKLSQSSLNDVINNSKDISICLYAIKMLNDQSVLVDISNNQSLDRNLRIAAADKLTDQSTLAEIALNTTDPSNSLIGIYAVKKLTDPDLIKKVAASNDTAQRIREIAEDKLNEDRYVQIVLDSDTELDQVYAIRHVYNQKFLEDIAKNRIGVNIRNNAISQLTDQTILTDIAKNGSQDWVRRDAIQWLIDQETLEDIAIHDPAPECRCAAAQGLYDEKLRNELLAKVLFKVVRDINKRGLTSSVIRSITDPSYLEECYTKLWDGDYMIGEDLRKRIHHLRESR